MIRLWERDGQTRESCRCQRLLSDGDFQARQSLQDVVQEVQGDSHDFGCAEQASPPDDRL